jgi:hypothetical protein
MTLLSGLIGKSLRALWCTKHFGILIIGDTQMGRKIGNQTFEPVTWDLFECLIAAKYLRLQKKSSEHFAGELLHGACHQDEVRNICHAPEFEDASPS